MGRPAEGVSPPTLKPLPARPAAENLRSIRAKATLPSNNGNPILESIPPPALKS